MQVSLAYGVNEKVSIETLTLGKNQLHPIYNLSSIHQPQKFAYTKDPTIVKEWLESVESVMSLFNMTNKKVRNVTYMFKSDAELGETSP